MALRRGLGHGMGKGYRNLVPGYDRYVHSLSAMGVKSVDLKRYQGDWYSQASLPAPFERGCSQSKASYNVVGDKIEVLNTCIRPGNDKYVRGTAYSVSEDNRALKVRFGPFMQGDYIIEYVSPDYNYAVVGHPEKKYLWIMARDQKIPDDMLDELVGIAEAKGYDVSRLKKTSTLNAKGRKLKLPTVQILSDAEFEEKFKHDYGDDEIGYATTKIHPDGDVHIYVRDSGDYGRNGQLLMHELKELEIWKDLMDKGTDPAIADEMAHNLNPVKVPGVLDQYELNAAT